MLAVLASATVLGAAQGDSIDAAALLADARTLSADDMQGREVGTPGGAKARAFIVSRFKEIGLAAIGGSFEHAFTVAAARRGGGVQGANVVGRIPGAGDSRRHVVLSAHYDHVGVQAGQIFNGANDNASGVAALFAIARALRARPPRHSMLFVAFDAEERGLRGSRAFVQSPPVDRSAIVLNLNMDMIGRDPNSKLFVSGVSTQPFLRPYIERAAARAPVRLLMGYDDPKGPQRDNWVRQSDQFSFIEANIPALYFGVEDYAQHHQPTDDFETMTRDFYVKAVETMVMVIREFDAGLDAIDAARPRP